MSICRMIKNNIIMDIPWKMESCIHGRILSTPSYDSKEASMVHKQEIFFLKYLQYICKNLHSLTQYQVC